MNASFGDHKSIINGDKIISFLGWKLYKCNEKKVSVLVACHVTMYFFYHKTFVKKFKGSYYKTLNHGQNSKQIPLSFQSMKTCFWHFLCKYDLDRHL